ncbi:MAG: UMP kinase [Clostridia bacterium]|nr:UMP kinase [Clostridia bacterium]
MYKRILLKISGEALAGENKVGINSKAVGEICDRIKVVSEKKIELAIVVGGGNFWRGRDGHEMDRVTSDYIGMLATVMNALAVKDALESRGVCAVVETAIDMNTIAESYTKRNSEKYLKEGKVVIFAAGTGHPYFSTDTCAALRAVEINAEAILVAKTIDGIYSADPKIDSSAVKYDNISYEDILKKNLKAMDSTSTAICMENNMPLVVFSIFEPDNIIKVVNGENIGTIVK